MNKPNISKRLRKVHTKEIKVAHSLNDPLDRLLGNQVIERVELHAELVDREKLIIMHCIKNRNFLTFNINLH